MRWIYTDQGVSIFVMGALVWGWIFLGSKFIQRKPMEQRGWFEPLVMVISLFIVMFAIGYFIGIDRSGWR